MPQATQNTTEPVSPVMRILKIATCPSVSRKSELTYHIGCNDKSEILMRVISNTSSGYFSKEAISMAAIQQMFTNVPADKGITSFLLQSLYEGKSQNNAGFLFAVLVAEKLVEPVPETRHYKCTDGKKFSAEVTALIKSGVSLKIDEPPVKAAGKLPGKVVAVNATPPVIATVQTAEVIPEKEALVAQPAASGKKAAPKATSKISKKAA